MPITVANKILPNGSWNDNPADVITLDEEDRYRRRILLTSDGGYDFMLSLPKAERLENGDGLLLEDGRVIKVLAKPEPLYKVEAGDKLALITLAWHLGNRHQPTEIYDDHLRIRQDAVIADMLEGLGAKLTEISAAFSPVSGAYVSKSAMEHHSHQHEHDHAH